MAVNFPSNPNLNDSYVNGDRKWIWNGRYWEGASVTVGYTGSIGYTGSVGNITALDNVPIGASTPSTGAFTVLGASGNITFTNGTVSTSTTTGALVVTGGIATADSVNVGKTVSVGTALTFGVDASSITSGATYDFDDIIPDGFSNSFPLTYNQLYISFTGNIAGTTLTVTGPTPFVGTLAVGQIVTGTGVLPGTYITAKIAGTGVGSTWTVSNSHSPTVTATFTIASITFANPWQLQVAIDGLSQSTFTANYDTVWFSTFLPSKRGFTIDSTTGNLKFADCVSINSVISVRTEPGANNQAVKVYPFIATDIMLGI